jgi:hypothetical protein
MDSSPNPLDPKYAPGAEQARQDVMVGVSVAMTLIGGKFIHFDNASFECSVADKYQYYVLRSECIRAASSSATWDRKIGP